MFRCLVACSLVVASISFPYTFAYGQDGFLKPWRLSYIYNDSAVGRTPRAEFFDTREQAERTKKLYEDGNSAARAFDKNAKLQFENLKIEQVAPTQWQEELVDNIRNAKQAVDKAKQVAEKGIGELAKERKVGATLTEYLKTTRLAQQNAQKLRGYLLSMTGDISRQTFSTVNREIENFNKQANSYNALVSSNETITALALEQDLAYDVAKNIPKVDPVAPVRLEELKGNIKSTLTSTSSLAGKSGMFTAPGTDLPVKFNDDGSVIFGSGATANEGYLIESGNQVTIATNGYVYHGKLSGSSMSGTRQKRGSTEISQWKIDLGKTKKDTAESNAGTAKELTENDVIGTWERAVWPEVNYPNDLVRSYQFNPDHTVTEVTGHGTTNRTWRLHPDGKGVLIEHITSYATREYYYSLEHFKRQ
jgi:hypothetical protein